MASLCLWEALGVLGSVLGRMPVGQVWQGLPCAPSHPQQDNGICLGRDDVKLPHLPSAACPGQGALRQLIPSIFKWPSKVSLNKWKLWCLTPVQAGRSCSEMPVLLTEAGAFLQNSIRSYLILRYLVILWLWTEGWEQDKRLEREAQAVMCLREKWVLKLERVVMLFYLEMLMLKLETEHSIISN